jgi:hypothetical protein
VKISSTSQGVKTNPFPFVRAGQMEFMAWSIASGMKGRAAAPRLFLLANRKQVWHIVRAYSDELSR